MKSRRQGYRELTRAELEDLHAVLRRAAERAEQKADPDAIALADAVADLAEDIVRGG